ncbi:MAG: calcium/sodium antiporter [Bacteroidetes bacterium]|nr:calcium/sodium antiporter [Bacteroidota bacterium]
MNYLMLLSGLFLLVIGGDFLVRAAVAISLKLNISKAIVGLTIVSFATSAPELIVSLKAALDGHPDISIGNVMGSNIANIGLVLGVTAIIFPITVGKQFGRLHWPAMMILSILLYLFMSSHLLIEVYEGIVLQLMLFGFIYLLLRFRKKEELEEEVDEVLRDISGVKTFLWLLISALGLYFGSELLVKGAVNIAVGLGVSERIIAVTVIALGTSLPELSASVVAALRQEKAISLGNLIGSNIFNIGSVIGISAIIHPIEVKSPELLQADMWWMLGLAFVLLPMTWMSNKRQISRLGGFVLVFCYSFYIISTFIQK